PVEGVSHKEGIGIGKVVVHSARRVVFVDWMLGIAEKLACAIAKVSAVRQRIKVQERLDRWTDVDAVDRCARSVARSLRAGEASRRARSRAGQNPSMGIGVGDKRKSGFPLSLTEPFV